MSLVLVEDSMGMSPRQLDMAGSLPASGLQLEETLLLRLSLSTGTRSLMVEQIVHLNTLSSRGHLTSEAQVIQ